MIATIHQANYLPYPGFFHKLITSDIFVVQDDVQFDERFTNRNKIISSTGWTWITIPVKKHHKTYPIIHVEINNDLPWKRLHWKNMTSGYNKAKFFHLYKDHLEQTYKKEWYFIFDLNYHLIIKIIEWLGIKIEIVKESELNVKGTATERLVNVCKAVGADTYISGSRGADYLNILFFEKNKINLQFQDYHQIPYEQNLSKSFIPDLSTIDLLANVGPDSLNLIKNIS